MNRLLFLFLFLFSINSGAQVSVKYFNAGWNSTNDVRWIAKITDCDLKKHDISKDTKSQSKYKVVVVPTIIIFVDGEEVERYQADLSFKMTVTREELQEKIDEILMSDF